MEFSARKIAHFLKGEVEGDANITVNNISKIEDGQPGTISFLANPKYTSYIYDTKASIVIVNKDFKAEKKINTTLIKVENAYEAFASLLELYNQNVNEKKGIEEPSYINESAILGENVYIGAFAYISSNAKIGDNVKIYPHTYIGDNVIIEKNTTIYSGVKIYSNCEIGKNCIIHAGTVIGSDGFGFAPKNSNDYKKIPQIGNVILEDDVEIGANTTIDRATLGSTIIRKGVKIDNLVQIAHNVEIGENTVIAGQTGISGSSKIGKQCMFGGQVGIAGHLNITDEVKIAAQSGIGSNIKNKGEIVQGSPAYNIREYQRSYVIFRKLPKLNNRINDIEKKIKKLDNNNQ